MSDQIKSIFYRHGLVPLSDFQTLMNWSDTTLEARRARGETPHVYKKGNVHCIREDDLVSWLTDGRPIVGSAKAADADATDDLLK